MSYSKHEVYIDSGFTMIELIIVIAIIGILAAVAVPKFLNLSSNASTSATQAVAGALTAASNTNFAARTANPALGSAISNCNQVPSLLQGGIPSGYTVNNFALSAGTSSSSCLVTGPNSTSASFQGTGIL